MAMTRFEEAVIKELKGIKDELHELNKRERLEIKTGIASGLSFDTSGEALQERHIRTNREV